MFKDDDEEEDNTFGVTRYPCMPSLVALQQMRNRHHLANLGRKLMKWTALATGTELRNIAGRLDKVYQSFSEDMRDAYIALARGRYFYPNLNKMVIEGCPSVAEVVLATSTRTASGVKIIKYDIIENNTHPYKHLGIEKGGQIILEAKRAWLDLLKRIILMVELRTNFRLVEDMHKAANKKWNVLSKMVIPRISLSSRYILSELEEIEREDNFRLKRFKELKTKKKEKDSTDTQALMKKTEGEGTEVENKELYHSEEEQKEPKLQFNSEIRVDSHKPEHSLDLDVKDALTQRNTVVDRKEDDLLPEITEKNDNISDFKIQEEFSLRLNTEIADDSYKLEKLLDLDVKHVESEQQDGGTRNNEKNGNEKCSCSTDHIHKDNTEPLHSDITRAVVNDEANGCFLDIMSHAEEIIKLSKRNNDICDSKVLAIQNELRAVLEKLFVDRVCNHCKKKIQVMDKKDSTHDDDATKSYGAFDELSVPDSMYSIQSADKDKLGRFERKYKEVIKVLRVQNEDGTISENKKKITVQTNKRNPIKAKSVEESTNKNLSCSCFESDSESGESIKRYGNGHQGFHHHNNDKRCHSNNETHFPACTKSEPICRSSQWNEAKPRQCISAEAVKETVKLDTGTCCCSRDITVNLTFQRGSCNELKNVNVSQLPLVPFINVNFCNLPTNILQESHVNNVCDDLCTTNEKTQHKTLQKSSSQIVIKENLIETCTCDLASTLERAVNESSHACDKVGADVETMGQNVSNNIVDISYIFNSVMNTNVKRVNNDAAESNCLQMPQFTYIFNNVKSFSDDTDHLGFLKIMDTLFEESCKYSTIFPQKFSCYKRIEIENMINDACSNVVNFPYIFSRCESTWDVKETTRSDAVTCCCPGDITVNFTFRGRSCDKLQSVNITQLPVAPSVNVNFCTLPKNIFQDSLHVNRLYDDLKETCEEVYDCRKTSSQIVTNRSVTTGETGTCRCDLNPKTIINKSSQAFSEIGDELEAMTKNVSTNIIDMGYIFDKVVKANVKYENNDVIRNTCFPAPEFEYIFSNVNKISDTEDCSEDSSNTINIFFKECCNYTTMFSYIFSSYKRIEIERMLKSACSQVVSFPYIFSNLKNETQASLSENIKIDINSMFSDACKRSFNFTYIFSHIKNAEIDDLIKRSCTRKFDFPYVFSNIRHEKPVVQNNGTSKKVEIEAMFKNACKRLTEFAYISNHLNSVKIDNMIKNACMYIPEFPYVFSKTENKVCSINQSKAALDRSNLITIDQMFKDSCVRSLNFDYIFCPAKTYECSNISLEHKCQSAKYNSNDCSYIFSKVNELGRYQFSNHLIDIDNIFIIEHSSEKQFTCDSHKVKEEKLTQLTERDHELRLQEINKLFQNSCKPISKEICNFSYIFQNINERDEENTFDYIFSKVNNKCAKCLTQVKSQLNNLLFENHRTLKHIDVDKYAASNMTYMFSKVSKSAASIKTSDDLDINVLFKDACFHKHNFPYLFNKLQCTDSTKYCNQVDYVRHQEIDKLFKDSCKRNSKANCVFKYIFDKVELKNKKEFVYIFSKINKSNRCLVGLSSFDHIKHVCNEKTSHDFEHRENILSTLPQDFYTLEADWYQKQRFGNFKSSMKECEQLNKNFNNMNYIFSKVRQRVGPLNYVEINAMFKDACKSKNNFPYIFNKIAQSPNREEIDKLFNESCKIDGNLKQKCGYLFKEHSECKSQRNKFICKCTKKSPQLARCSSCTGLINKGMKPQSISSQISSTKNINEASHRILVRLPSSKGGSSCLGIEVAWRTGRVCNNSLLSKNQSTTAKSLISSKSCCDLLNKNTNDKGMHKSTSLYNQKNVSPSDTGKAELMKDQTNISLIKRMLDTIKNVYVPFSKSVTAEEINKHSSEIDNVNSILSNSTTSTYSWKSCVMKTCQAEMESEQKNISYSGFSLGSSLDYVSYKSEGTGSMGEKRILLDIEMPSGRILHDTGSCLTTNRKNPSKVILKTHSNISDKSTYSDIAKKQNKENLREKSSNYMDAQKSLPILKQKFPSEVCTRNHQFNRSVIGAGSCSSISVYKHICPLSLECCCYICKQHNNYKNVTTQCCHGLAPCFSNRNARSVQESRSLDKNKCSCNKKHP